MVSDLVDFVFDVLYFMVFEYYYDGVYWRDYVYEMKENIDVDGDDEFVMNDEEEEDNVINIIGDGYGYDCEVMEEDYFIIFVVSCFINDEFLLIDFFCIG